MTKILDNFSRTFSEYLLIPRLTKRTHTIQNTSLKTPIMKFKKGEESRMYLNIPLVSASMQSASGYDMGVALARQGGVAFTYCSQSIESQAEMISKIKSHKAGFVKSKLNLRPDASLQQALDLMNDMGHSTVAVTDDGSGHGIFLGLLRRSDFWVDEDDMQSRVPDFMTPKDELATSEVGLTLREANKVMHKHKSDVLPVLKGDGSLDSLVFKKDYLSHINNPLELLDSNKRLIAAAGVNTHDYKQRLPALVEAGVDIIAFDSSDGYSEYQRDAALWARKKYGSKIVIGGGNVVSAEGFRYLVEEADVDFVKVGIGGGSICITREQKGIGRGQASAVLDVIAERDAYYKETGIYVPVCSDGGIAYDTQIIIALSMGVDFIMLGRYFAATDESPTQKVVIKGHVYKPYWGEGSNRARNWQRYGDDASKSTLVFEEGVDGYIPVQGSVKDVVGLTLAKLRATMCNLGSSTLKEFADNAVLTLVSNQSIVEGGTNSILQLDSDKLNVI